MAEKYIWFDGLKYTRDEKTGYYLNATHRKRLHRAVWEHYNGEIPEGYQVHHVDGDKSNNDISNLALLDKHLHAARHSGERVQNHYNEIIDNLDRNARPAANRWHGSDEGREWHKKHYEGMKERLHKKVSFACEQCGKTFEAQDNGANRFCSNACKSAWRRASGVDNVVRRCVCCGRKFESSKYGKAETCSRSCANKLRWIRKNQTD